MKVKKIDQKDAEKPNEDQDETLGGKTKYCKGCGQRTFSEGWEDGLCDMCWEKARGEVCEEDGGKHAYEAHRGKVGTVCRKCLKSRGDTTMDIIAERMDMPQ